MAQDHLDGASGGGSGSDRRELHETARRILTERWRVRDALPSPYSYGPLAEMLLWLYTSSDRPEGAFYRATSPFRSEKAGRRWVEVILQDGLVSRADGELALTQSGVELVEEMLKEF
jgi:hypothetical protein